MYFFPVPPASNWIPIATANSSCDIHESEQNYLPVSHNFEMHIVVPRFDICYDCANYWVLKVIAIEPYTKKTLVQLNIFVQRTKILQVIRINTSDAANKINRKVKFKITSVDIAYKHSVYHYLVTDAFAVTVGTLSSF